MKLKKTFMESHSSKDILHAINKVYELYLKKHQSKATVSLLLSAEGEKGMISWSMVARYEKEQQNEIDRMAVIVNELVDE